MNDRPLLPEVIGATVEAAFIAAHAEILAPGARFAVTAVATYFLSRYRRADEILRSELERAGATAQDFKDTEQFAAAAIRYARAARDQAADENLLILAQAMIGLARRQEFWASDFLKYAEILAPLSRDELILIGRMMAEDLRFYATPRPQKDDGQVWAKAGLGDYFPTTEYINAVGARAQRSGLITPIAMALGVSFELSPIGREVREIVDVDAAVRGLRPGR